MTEEQDSIAKRLRRNTRVRTSLLFAALAAFALIPAANADEIRATDLQAAFEANNLRAEGQYSGRQYDVVGQFNDAQSTLFGGVSVTMAGDNMFIGSFTGSLAAEERNTATRFNKGDVIRLRCILGGTIMTMPTGKDCRFVTAATLRAEVSPAAAPARPEFVAAPTTAQTEPPAAAKDPSEDGGYTSFKLGKNDRKAWEVFFAQLEGDERAGANWWTGQRSLKAPGSCFAGSTISAFQNGCAKAQAMLNRSDALRKSNPEYRAGWNGL